MEVTDELLDWFLDGAASNDETALVHAWLTLPANMEQFAMRAAVHADLRRSLHRRKIQQEALAVCDENGSGGAFEDGVEPARRQFKRGAYVLVAGALATAACIDDRLFRARPRTHSRTVRTACRNARFTNRMHFGPTRSGQSEMRLNRAFYSWRWGLSD